MALDINSYFNKPAGIFLQKYNSVSLAGVKKPFTAECLVYLSKANSRIAVILGGIEKKTKTKRTKTKTKLLNTTYKEIPLNPLDTHALASQYTADAKLFFPVL